jgi:hypothetical protein
MSKLNLDVDCCPLTTPKALVKLQKYAIIASGYIITSWNYLVGEGLLSLFTWNYLVGEGT